MRTQYIHNVLMQGCTRPHNTRSNKPCTQQHHQNPHTPASILQPAAHQPGTHAAVQYRASTWMVCCQQQHACRGVGSSMLAGVWTDAYRGQSQPANACNPYLHVAWLPNLTSPSPQTHCAGLLLSQKALLLHSCTTQPRCMTCNFHKACPFPCLLTHFTALLGLGPIQPHQAGPLLPHPSLAAQHHRLPNVCPHSWPAASLLLYFLHKPSP
jgi:hypothetical protein